MPTGPQHRTQAEHSEYFVSTLGNPFWDWAVTGTFYAAVHYVDGYLSTKGIDPAYHPERNDYINKDPVLKPLWGDCRELINDSRSARYDIGAFNQADVARLGKNLDAIKKVLAPLIK